MSLTVSVNGSAIADAIPPSSVQATQMANDGEAAFGGFSVDDPGADILTVGHKAVVIEESECSQPRLFTGWTTQRDMGRSDERGMIVADDRLHDVTTVDLNACLRFRILRGSDCKRPEESMDARMAWIISKAALTEFVTNFDSVATGYSRVMDEADYRGMYPGDVLDDITNREIVDVCHFVFWDATAEEVALYFGSQTEATTESTLAISNDASDVDGSTIFPPDSGAQLARKPDQVYSQVMLVYREGTRRVYRERESTATGFVDRGITIQRPRVKKKATAESQAERFLTAHAHEIDTINCTIIVPAESAGLAVAGQRITVKFSHLDGYQSWTSMRIVQSTATPTNDVASHYAIALELEKPESGEAPGGACECSDTIELVQYTTVGGDDLVLFNPQEITLDDPATCGNLLVMVLYERNFDVPWVPGLVNAPGFDVLTESYYGPGDDQPRSKYLGVFTRTVEDGDGDTFSIQTGDGGLVQWDGTGLLLLAEYSGVQVDSGTPVALVVQDDLTPAMPAYTPATTRETIVCAAVFWQPGEEQNETVDGGYVQVFDSGNPGGGDRHRMAFWTKTVASPSGSYSGEFTGLTDSTTDTHFVMFGLVECQPDTEEDLEEGPFAPVESTSDPTVDDDIAAGYFVGQLWINTSSSLTYLLTDNTAGAAVWTLITTGAPAWSFATSDGVTTVDPTTELTFVGPTLTDLGSGVAELTFAVPALDDLSDVVAGAPDDGDVLAWDDYLGYWAPVPAGGSLALDDLTDVDAVAPDDGDVLTWDDGAGDWVAAPAPSASGIAATLLDAKGDMIVASADDTAAKLTVGTNGYLLRANSGATNGVEWAAQTAAIIYVIDGGGSAITTGVKGFLQVPFACTITAARLLADTSGAIVVDIWLEQYADYPPTDADTITSSTPPTITASGVKSEDTTLTSWTTSIAAGDILGFNVDSCTSITRVTVELVVTKG